MHISFDFDYTLADSSQGAILCANYALKSMGKSERSDTDIKKTIGLSLDETYKQLVDDYSPDELESFSTLFLTKADEVVVDCIVFFARTREVLSELKRNGHYLSIVSTKFSKRIKAALQRDGLESLIDYVVGGDMVNEAKPSPEGLNLAINHSNISKSQTIYIGDSKSDGLAANAAGVKFIAVLSGMTTSAKLAEYDPVEILNDLGGLIKVVHNIGDADQC